MVFTSLLLFVSPDRKESTKLSTTRKLYVGSRNLYFGASANEGQIRGIERRVLSSASMLNGFRKKPTAPALKARCCVASSACADMKIIGTSRLDAFSRCCNSRPLIPGKFTSRIRQIDA